MPVTGVNVTAIDDKFFAREKEAKKGAEDAMFSGEAKETVVSAERKAAQITVDAALMKNIAAVDASLSAYISSKFSLSKADKPHSMVF